MGSPLGMAYTSTAPFRFLPLARRRGNFWNLEAAGSLFLHLCGLRGFAGFLLFLLEPVKFLVLPEDKSKGRRHDVIRRAADECCVAVKGLSERCLKLEFSGHHRRWFLDEGHCRSPFALLGCFRKFSSTADKTPGTESVPLGGSDPTNLLGGSTSQKVGSLPPKLRVLSAVFFHGLELVSPSLLGVYAGGRQNPRGRQRPDARGWSV